jgi:hypothetical protein
MGPIRNPSWEQKRTVGYVTVSRFFGVRTVTIPCTLNLSINLERGISESSREANF